MSKFAPSEASHKSQLWRKGAARIYAELRDQRICGATRKRLDEAREALIKAAGAILNDDRDPPGGGD